MRTINLAFIKKLSKTRVYQTKLTLIAVRKREQLIVILSNNTSVVIGVEISNIGLVSIIRENESPSNSEESYDQFRISNTRSPSPVVPFWLYESETDDGLSSRSIYSEEQNYALDDYIRSEEYATALESGEPSLDHSVPDDTLLSSTPNNEDQ